MPTQKKVDYVNKLIQSVTDNPSFVLVDHDSTTHKELEELKTSLRADGQATFKVIKNSLFHVAVKRANNKEKIAKNEDVEEMINTGLKGQSALVSFSGDWFAGLQSFYRASKKFEGISFKAGLIEGTIYLKDKLDTLAQLPSRETLMGRIIGSLRGPQYGLVRALKWDAGRFVRVLKGMGENKS